MLTNVTLTGADDTVNPKALIELSREFPFVEWGILIGSRGGVSRFPSAEWLGVLLDELPIFEGRPVNLSLHVCGRILRTALNEGKWIAGEVEDFGRMQLNFHGEPIAAAEVDRQRAVHNILEVHSHLHIPEVIVQLDGVNDWMLDALLLHDVRASGLYDRSHGGGVKPQEWPKPNPAWKVGYAGGIGPESIAEDLQGVLAAAGGRDVWIDMETKLFTDGKFDLVKCRTVLEACKGVISGGPAEVGGAPSR